MHLPPPTAPTTPDGPTMSRWGASVVPKVADRRSIVIATLVGVSIAIVVSIALVGMNTIESVRAYVGGEGLWSKSQKEAAFSLQRYASTRDERYFTEYERELSVPLGDHIARLELEKAQPDYGRVRAGFLQGGNHPDDVDKLATLFRRFGWVSYMARAKRIWHDGDAFIEQLQQTGREMHDEVNARHPNEAHIAALAAKVEQINVGVRPLEDDFSANLGAAARWTHSVLNSLLIVTAIILLGVGLWQSRRTVRQWRVVEAELQHSQKMHAVGQLAGGIAHDMNNVLTVIGVNAELLEHDAKDPELRASVRDLRTAARHGGDLVAKLLAFARRRPLQPVASNTAEAITEVTTMLQHLLPETIDVRLVVDADTPAISVDRTSLAQILMNLGTNARDAMPSGGMIVIHASRAPGPGLGTAVITVRDTGTGMDARTLERAFEPFFTTKPVGAGTGLGLAMVFGLMEQHGAKVTIKSDVNDGTTVRLEFPGVAEPERSAASVDGAQLASDVAVIPATILVVEDEPAVRDGTRRVLEAAGFTVLTAQDGQHALETVRKRGGNIHLVLSDVVMPRMTGPALYRALINENYPGRFIFVSGYPPPADAASYMVVPFIAKPWTSAELVARIRAELRRGAGTTANSQG